MIPLIAMIAASLLPLLLVPMLMAHDRAQAQNRRLLQLKAGHRPTLRPHEAAAYGESVVEDLKRGRD
jgi:hypothetical protein